MDIKIVFLYQTIWEKASYTFVTPDSVNMIFESLSSLSKTYVFSTDTQKDTKVTKLIKNLVNNNSLNLLKKMIFQKIVIS